MENPNLLPPELITEILIRLPSKNLLRFTSVSKPWNSLISSPRFIKSHLKRSIETSSNFFLINMDESSLYTAKFFPEDSSISNVTATNLPQTLRPQYLDYELVGSCNGLICISNNPYWMALYNPSTRSCKEIPICSDAPGVNYEITAFSCWVNYGFGYDQRGDDYKVVRIDQLFSNRIPEVRVFSLRADRWKRIANFPYSLPFPRAHGKLVNNRLHWSAIAFNFDADENDENFIYAGMVVSFDLHTESFDLIPVPDALGTRARRNLTSVSVLDDKLLFIDIYYLEDERGVCDFWLMKEYGVKGSWTKLFTFPYEEQLPNGTAMPVVNIIAYSKGGQEILMEQDNRYYWYDLKSKKVRDAGVHGFPPVLVFEDNGPTAFGAELCVDSLISFSQYSNNKTSDEKVETGKGRANKINDFLSKGFKLKL